MTAGARNRLRLLLRDLAAGAAFSSMAVSGQLPVWALATFGLGLLLALLRRRILTGRGTLTAILLGVGGLALYGAVATESLDLVVAACTFAGFITLHRMLSAPTPATDSQVYLTSLLMTAGGAALSGEMIFALCLLAFATLACLSLGLTVVEQALPEGAEIPVSPVVRQLAWGMVAALVGSITFFVLFPRLSWNMASRRVSPGLGSATAGFSDRVRLGGDGSIKKNPRVVLRATLRPDPGVPQLDAYWIGRTFDTFRGDEWAGQGEVRKATSQVKLRSGARQQIYQVIEVLPAYGSRTLVALDPPVLLGNATAHAPSGNTRTQLIEVEGEEVRFEVSALGYSYYAYSLPRAAPEEAPRESPDRYLPLPDRYLTLPARLDPRVAELARQVAGGETDRLKVARKLEAYLKTSYEYTLELSGDVEDPLVDFLFVRKKGHCEHFATALAVMLRTLGIPSRVAAGFYGGERIGNHYVLRAGDAHAWTQVLVPGRGFVTLDATPEASRPGQPAPWLEWITRQYEALDALWRSTVVEYSFRDQVQLARSLVGPRHSRGSQRRLPEARTLLGGLCFLVALYALYRAWRWRPLPPPQRKASEATALLDAIERVLRQAPVRRAGEGIEELSARLTEHAHPLGGPLAKVTRRYLEARFGDQPLVKGERSALIAELREAIQRLRSDA